jgi:hypothetical protein
MAKRNKKTEETEVKKVNGFTQSMNDFDYNLVEQYQEELIAEQQVIDEKVEEPAEIPAEPLQVETSESPAVEEPEEEIATEELAASVITPPFQADVSLNVVEEIFTALKNKPTSVVVKLRDDEGYLVIKVIITFKSKITREYETYADKMLLSLIMRGMRGIIVSMDDYGRDPHILEFTGTDPRIELFRLFLESTLKCRISPDYISRNDPSRRFFCADFTIADRMIFHFCLDRTEEINEIINKAIA